MHSSHSERFVKVHHIPHLTQEESKLNAGSLLVTGAGDHTTLARKRGYIAQQPNPQVDSDTDSHWSQVNPASRKRHRRIGPQAAMAQTERSLMWRRPYMSDKGKSESYMERPLIDKYSSTHKNIEQIERQLGNAEERRYNEGLEDRDSQTLELDNDSEARSSGSNSEATSDDDENESDSQVSDQHDSQSSSDSETVSSASDLESSSDDDNLRDRRDEVIYFRLSSSLSPNKTQKLKELLRADYPDAKVIVDVQRTKTPLLQRTGLEKLLLMIFNRKVTTVFLHGPTQICATKEGFQLFQWICEMHGTTLQIVPSLQLI
jgi:hypothetical protein